jgi:hypothetical protein
MFRYTRLMLVCPVRDCRMALLREERRLLCPRRHSFDIARSGYINLLQPQERRSKRPGDTVAAVAARRRLHDRGLSEPLLHAIEQTVAPHRTISFSTPAVVMVSILASWPPDWLRCAWRGHLNAGR